MDMNTGKLHSYPYWVISKEAEMIRPNPINRSKLYYPDWSLDKIGFVFNFSSDKKSYTTQYMLLSSNQYTVYSGHWQNKILQNVTKIISERVN